MKEEERPREDGERGEAGGGGEQIWKVLEPQGREAEPRQKRCAARPRAWRLAARVRARLCGRRLTAAPMHGTRAGARAHAGAALSGAGGGVRPARAPLCIPPPYMYPRRMPRHTASPAGIVGTGKRARAAEQDLRERRSGGSWGVGVGPCFRGHGGDVRPKLTSLCAAPQPQGGFRSEALGAGIPRAALPGRLASSCASASLAHASRWGRLGSRASSSPELLGQADDARGWRKSIYAGLQTEAGKGCGGAEQCCTTAGRRDVALKLVQRMRPRASRAKVSKVTRQLWRSCAASRQEGLQAGGSLGGRHRQVSVRPRREGRGRCRGVLSTICPGQDELNLIWFNFDRLRPNLGRPGCGQPSTAIGAFRPKAARSWPPLALCRRWGTRSIVSATHTLFQDAKVGPILGPRQAAERYPHPERFLLQSRVRRCDTQIARKVWSNAVWSTKAWITFRPPSIALVSPPDAQICCGAPQYTKLEIFFNDVVNTTTVLSKFGQDTSLLTSASSGFSTPGKYLEIYVAKDVALGGVRDLGEMPAALQRCLQRCSHNTLKAKVGKL